MNSVKIVFDLIEIECKVIGGTLMMANIIGQGYTTSQIHLVKETRAHKDNSHLTNLPFQQSCRCMSWLRWKEMTDGQHSVTWEPEMVATQIKKNFVKCSPIDLTFSEATNIRTPRPPMVAERERRTYSSKSVYE